MISACNAAFQHPPCPTQTPACCSAQEKSWLVEGSQRESLGILDKPEDNREEHEVQHKRN